MKLETLRYWRGFRAGALSIGSLMMVVYIGETFQFLQFAKISLFIVIGLTAVGFVMLISSTARPITQWKRTEGGSPYEVVVQKPTGPFQRGLALGFCLPAFIFFFGMMVYFILIR